MIDEPNRPTGPIVKSPIQTRAELLVAKFEIAVIEASHPMANAANGLFVERLRREMVSMVANGLYGHNAQEPSS